VFFPFVSVLATLVAIGLPPSLSIVMLNSDIQTDPQFYVYYLTVRLPSFFFGGLVGLLVEHARLLAPQPLPDSVQPPC